jgi:hypothetical protein
LGRSFEPPLVGQIEAASINNDDSSAGGKVTATILQAGIG